MFKRHMHETLEVGASVVFFVWQLINFAGKPLFAPCSQNLLTVAPNIKTVSFHFQTSIYGIKCNIARKNCAVDLKERHTLCELLRRVEAA